MVIRVRKVVSHPKPCAYAGTQAALLHFVLIPLWVVIFILFIWNVLWERRLNKYSQLGEIEPMACFSLGYVAYSLYFSKSWALANDFSGRIMIKRSYVWRHKSSNILFIAYKYQKEIGGGKGKPRKNGSVEGWSLLQIGCELLLRGWVLMVFLNSSVKCAGLPALSWPFGPKPHEKHSEPFQADISQLRAAPLCSYESMG